MTEHTPGPWRYQRGNKQNPLNGCVCAPDGTLMHLTAVMNKRDESDARLIAAAPELLEALKDAEFLLRKVSINWREAASMADSMKRSAEDARAAIAKARG